MGFVRTGNRIAPPFARPRRPLPTRLERYVLAEILRIFVVSLVVLTTLILLIGVGRELIRRGLGVTSVIQLLPFVLPISLQFAFPATALFAVCSVFGRMAADGEVATVKSSGVSPLRLLTPAIIFASLLSPLAVYVSDLAVSWGRPGVNRVVLLSIEDIAYRVLRSQHSYTSDHGFSIHVLDVVGKRLIRPTMTIHRKGSEPFRLTATEGELALDAETKSLVFKVLDSQLIGGSSLDSTIPGVNEFPIPLGAMGEKPASERSPSELPLALIAEQVTHETGRARDIASETAAATASSILTSNLNEISGGEGRQRGDALKRSKKRLRRLKIEPWRRWAWGFSCLCFVMVGAPLAMIQKTGDNWKTFGVCFLPTLLVYYPLFIFGLEQAKDGAIPPQGIWIGNIVLIFIAAGLIERVRKH